MNDHKRFNYCIVFRNPSSTHAAQTQKYLDQLHAIFGKNLVAIDVPDKKNSEELAQKLCQTDYANKCVLMCIAGGDGTANTVIEMIYKARILPAQLSSAPILPLWGGNANDLATMLNGSGAKADLKNIVLSGKIIPIHPIRFKLEDQQGDQEIRIASCYASFGALALAAKKLDQKDYRSDKLLQIPGVRKTKEFMTVARALAEAQTFKIKGQDGTRVVYDYTFVKGPHLAALKNLPTKLNQRVFFTNELGKYHILSFWAKLFRAALNQTNHDGLRHRLSFTTAEKVWAQFDGEPQELAANTKVHVRICHRPLFVLSTKLLD